MKDNRIVIQITVQGARKLIAWKEGDPGSRRDLLRAKAMAETLQAEADAGTWQPPSAQTPVANDLETFEAWSKRWLDDRTRRGLRSVRDDLGRLRAHVWTVIGNKPIATVTRADVESIVERLDTLTSDGALAWKTASNTWGVVSKAFADACGSKTKALRVRLDNPAAGVAPPDRGSTRSRAYLYPEEVARLLSCQQVRR